MCVEACVMQLAVKGETKKQSTKTQASEKSNDKKNTDAGFEFLNTNTSAEGAQTTTEATTAPATTPPWWNVDFQNPSWDIFIVIFFVVASLLYGLSLGRDRIIIILVSIYMSLAIVQALPDFVLHVTFNQQVAFQITTFISLFVVLFFLISRSALMRTLGARVSEDGKLYQTIIFSILHVGLLISITMSFLPPDILNKFAPFTKQIFTGEWEQFGWIAAPMVAMVVFGSRKKSVDD